MSFFRRTTSRGRSQPVTAATGANRNYCPDSFIIGPNIIGPNIINEASQINIANDEYELLRLGPRFIFNDPKTASKRRATELAILQRKVESRFHKQKVSPGRPVQEFISELNLILQNYHNAHRQAVHPSKRKTKNYHRLVKRLKYKIRLTKTLIRKTDKAKVFHLGHADDYQKKSIEYMNKTNAYHCIGNQDPLPDLIQRTNKYLLDLRLAKWITQKQYEELGIKKEDDVQLAHLYYLPKTHKIGTPLRPIISGLKHPTLKISKFLDNVLRPLFDKMASATTVMSGFELLKKLHQWSILNMQQETLLCTIDIADLYTMIPQVEGILSLRQMLNYLQLKQINGLTAEVIIRLARFVMQNNYFSYNGQYYHQIRGGAMGSPLTLTIANCYMFFYEQDIVRQINNSKGLYLRYIDDIFLIINWPARHLFQQIERWKNFDPNIKLSANISHTIDFLDLHIENKDGQLVTSVYHKPSYEPYYLPFNSVHPIHMKKNMIFTMLLRAIRYCSTYEIYFEEREKLRMALLINRYPIKFIDSEFNGILRRFNIHHSLTSNNYQVIRSQIIYFKYKEKVPINYDKQMFIHFTYCSSMRTFPQKFHSLWNKYFGESPINEIIPILGTRNADNLQRRLVNTH